MSCLVKTSYCTDTKSSYTLKEVKETWSSIKDEIKIIELLDKSVIILILCFCMHDRSRECGLGVVNVIQIF